MMKPEELDASVRITKHAKQRSKERAGLTKSSLERMLPKIVSEGRRSGDFVGSFQRYLNGLHGIHSMGYHKDIVVYALYIYVLVDKRVITVLQVPKKYLKVVLGTRNGCSDEVRSFEKIKRRSRCST